MAKCQQLTDQSVFRIRGMAYFLARPFHERRGKNMDDLRLAEMIPSALLASLDPCNDATQFIDR